MKIICDTRQKKGHHDFKHEQMQKFGAELVFQALPQGDYMDADSMAITVDTKQDLQEVAQNLGVDKERFMKEVRRCYENHIKLVVLIEQGGKIKSIKDVYMWQPKYGKMTGRVLAEKMYKIHIAYSVEFLFCDKRQTGKKIIELLNGGTKK